MRQPGWKEAGEAAADRRSGATALSRKCPILAGDTIFDQAEDISRL